MWHYRSSVMQQRGCNSIATIVPAINMIFIDVIYKYLIIHIDDIIITSKNYNQDIEALRKVLRCLQDYQFRLQDSKCQVFTKGLHIQGHMFTCAGHPADLIKVQKILDFPEPRDKKELQALPERQRKRNTRYNTSYGSFSFHTPCGFTPRFGQVQMPYPRHKIIADTDRHAQVANDLRLGTERQTSQANNSSNQRPRSQIGQKLMLLLHNIKFTNANKKMKPRWLGRFPITQGNYQRNDNTLDFSRNSDR